MRTALLLAPLFAAALLALSGNAHGADRIGYVDMMRAFTEVEEGRAGLQELERFKNDRQTVLDEKQNALKSAKEDLDRQGMLIKPEVRQQKMEDLQRQMLETQQLFFNLQKELSQKEMEFKVSISRKLQVVIQEIAEKEGYSLVLDSSPGGSVVFGRAADDITSEVIRRYNAVYAGSVKNKGTKGKKKKSG